MKKRSLRSYILFGHNCDYLFRAGKILPPLKGGKYIIEAFNIVKDFLRENNMKVSLGACQDLDDYVKSIEDKYEEKDRISKKHGQEISEEFGKY
jgi:hypothetical protein